MARANRPPIRGRRSPGATRPHCTHSIVIGRDDKDRNVYQKEPNPAGSKLLRRFFKAKNEMRGSYKEAAAWYANYNPERKTG